MGTHSSNVKQFQVIGDGATDDTAAIEAAIDSLQPAGGELYFPPGTYRLGSDITFPANTTLVLERGALLVPDSGITVTIDGMIDAGLYPIFTAAADQGEVRGRMAGADIYPQWWGAQGNGTGDDTEAIQQAMNSLAHGGGTLRLPAGTYVISEGLNINGLNQLNIIGAGVDVTILKSTSATADVFYSTRGQSQRWQRFKDFTIDSAVPKTTGGHFNLLGNQYRTVIEHVKLQNWHKGIVFACYEMCWITRVHIANPSAGAEAAIQAGIHADAAQGANLFITEAFLRGTDGIDGVSSSSEAIGKYGVAIYDTDAVMLSNSDIGGFINNDLLIDPLTRSSNHYFDNVWFDATRDDAPILLQGTGIKTELSFANNWVASAGHMGGGCATANNLRITGSGTYRAVTFTGNRFFNSSGTGIVIDAVNGFSGLFTGNAIHDSGTAGIAGENYGMKIDTGLNQPSVTVMGCTFEENRGDDIYVTEQASNYIIQNVKLTGRLINKGVAARIADIAADPAAAVRADESPGLLELPPFGEFHAIDGTADITGIQPTWAGHSVTLKFNAPLAVRATGGNLSLAGDFAAAADSTLGLVCDGTRWYEKFRSLNQSMT